MSGLDLETEILTKRGFVKINNLCAGEVLLNMDMKNGLLDKDVIVSKDYVLDYFGNILSLRNRRIDFRIMENNECVVIKEDGDFGKIKSKSIFESKERFFIPSCVANNKKDYEISDKMLQLYIQIVTDGSLANSNLIRFHLKKERKITRLKYLLKILNIDFYESSQKSGSTKINFTLPSEMSNLKIKPLDSFVLKLSKRQVDILFNEYCITDGNKSGNSVNCYQISTHKKSESDLLQELFIRNGYSCNLSSKKTPKGDDRYILSINNDGKFSTVCSKFSVRIKNEKTYGDFIRISTKNGNLVTRRNGLVSILGSD